MKHHDLFWKMQDGQTLYAQAWEPEGEPRGVICLVHGLGEHSGRYSHVARAMVDAGYAMLAFDLRGHGKTEGKRGHIASYEVILSDISYLLEQAAQRYPGKPRFLYGHSLGGNLVIVHGLRCRPPVKGVISTSPALGVGEQPKLKLMLGRLLYKLSPATTMPNGLELAGLCKDERVIQAYQADPHVHNQISARLALDMLDSGAWAMEHAAEFPVPLLLIHGDQDRLTSCSSTGQFAQRAPASTTFKKWPEGYHELHNDSEQQAVFKTILNWMEGL